jgi:hypothetical protein
MTGRHSPFAHNNIVTPDMILYEVTPEQMSHKHNSVLVANKNQAMFTNGSASLHRMR